MKFSFLLFLLFFFSVFALTLQARTVSLSWDPSSDAALAGYYLYYGTSSDLYTQQIDVGNVNIATVPNLDDNNSYFFVVTSYNTSGAESSPTNEVVSPVALLTAPTPPAGRLLNLSVRCFVETGDDVMIGGFIISGSSNKKVILRALGPSLVQSGLSDAMADPVLELHDATGAIVATNSGWTTDEAEVLATSLPPEDSREAAIVATLPVGSYSAIVQSATRTPGTALFEIYDLDPAGNSELANISTRGRVEEGDHVMIGGFILGGMTPASVMLRAIGPSLSNVVPDVLLDPTLALYSAASVLLWQNDNWADTQAAMILASGIAPGNAREAAMIQSLPAGAYSGLVQGVNNGAGNALIEVYNLSAGTTIPSGTGNPPKVSH